MAIRTVRLAKTSTLLRPDRGYEGALGRWLGSAHGNAQPQSPRPNVEFELVRGQFWPPRGIEARLGYGSIGVWRIGADVFLGHPGGIGGWVDLETGTGAIVAPRRVADACWTAIHQCLRPLWFFALARRGLHAVHAAGVAVGHQSVLIIGATGSGKSTLAARFGEEGAALLSDDTVLVDQETLEVSGFGDPCRLHNGDGSSALGAPDPDGKRAIPAAAVTTGPAVPRRLLVLNATPMPNAVNRPLAPGDVMVHLLRSGYLTVDPESDVQRLWTLARLAECCPATEVQRRPRPPAPYVVRSWLRQLCASA